jgi:hypothetical protein
VLVFMSKDGKQGVGKADGCPEWCGAGAARSAVDWVRSERDKRLSEDFDCLDLSDLTQSNADRRPARQART